MEIRYQLKHDGGSGHPKKAGKIETTKFSGFSGNSSSTSELCDDGLSWVRRACMSESDQKEWSTVARTGLSSFSSALSHFPFDWVSSIALNHPSKIIVDGSDESIAGL